MKKKTSGQQLCLPLWFCSKLKLDIKILAYLPNFENFSSMFSHRKSSYDRIMYEFHAQTKKFLKMATQILEESCQISAPLPLSLSLTREPSSSLSLYAASHVRVLSLPGAARCHVEWSSTTGTLCWYSYPLNPSGIPHDTHGQCSIAPVT